jgi:hypothetical protein
MKHRRLLVGILIAAVAVFGATQAYAKAHDITGYPDELTKVDLDGYVLQTSYTLGNNAGNTFRQTYLPNGTFSAVCVSGPFAPCAGGGSYVAMPVDKRQLMVTWYDANGVLNDVFVFNFKTGIVSDVAPGAPGSTPGSLGTVKVLHAGDQRIP